jgi:hypothetical protein
LNFYSSDVECPYCGAGLEINHDDGRGYDESVLHQQECSECDRVFVFTASISYSYDAQKADCLNDGEHEYELTRTYPRRYAKLRCKHCDDEQQLPEGRPYLTEEN